MFVGIEAAIDLERSLGNMPVPHLREIDVSEFDSGLKFIEREETIPWQLALKPEAKEAKELSPEQQAYKTLGLDLKEIPKNRRLTEDEADAFNTMDKLLGAKDKLIGNDGKFTKGDIPAIKASLQWYERVFAGQQLHADKDLLAGKSDNAVRKISSKDLLLFKAARDTLVKYAKRIGHKPESKAKRKGDEPVEIRYVPQDQASLRDFVKALALDKEIPESVKSRPLKRSN